METNGQEASGRTEGTAAEHQDARRERSSIEFPYMDLSTALDVARAVYARNGSADCQLDELAAQMNLSPSSSGFRTRLAAARVFGFINSARGSDFVSLTDLGLRAVDKQAARKAKADAFLEVDLFRAVYEEFKGKQLPPAAALQRQLESFGVAHKQTERARQILERSAETAGFFESGRDRLVRPSHLGGDDAPEPKQDDRKGKDEYARGGGGGGDDGLPPIDPIIRALLAHLPPPKSVWPSNERDEWLNLLRGSFRFIYREPPANDDTERPDRSAAEANRHPDDNSDLV